MRLYKAVLNEKYDVIEYDFLNNESEKVFSFNNEDIFVAEYEISRDAIIDYVELLGYFTINSKPNNSTKFIMYINIDFVFNILTDLDSSIIVRDQIMSSIRIKRIEDLFNTPKVSEGITGRTDLVIGSSSFMFHKYQSGIWDTEDEDIITINPITGLVIAKKIGAAQISYKVDSGGGILTCFKTLTVKEFCPVALLN